MEEEEGGDEGGTQEYGLKLQAIPTGPNVIIGGDVNCHGTWDTLQPNDGRGAELEEWAAANDLELLNTQGVHTRTNPATGGRSAPDVTLAGRALRHGAKWTTQEYRGSDHLPIAFAVQSEHHPTRTRRGRPRYNYRKADWARFREELDAIIDTWTDTAITVDARSTRLNTAILKAAGRAIPYGARKGPNKAFWNDTCEKARNDCRTARREAERTKTEQAIHSYNTQKRRTEKTIQEEYRKFLEEKIGNMNKETDLYRTLDAIQGRRPNAKPAATIERPSTNDQRHQPSHPARNDKEKANLFCQIYASVSRIQKDKAGDKEIKLEARRATQGKCNACSGDEDNPCCPFTRQELKAAMRKLRKGKSPGEDGVTNDMLRQLTTRAEDELLALVNETWRTAALPSNWRTATIIPIHKKGKPQERPENYRPVALTSCVAKLSERLVMGRLQHFLEKNNLIAPEQAGFRRGRGTEEQLARMTQDIFDALEASPPERAIVAFLDKSRAYDRVWKHGLFAKMDRMGIPRCWTRWVAGLLTDRRARVRWNDTLSRQRIFRDGLPQGSVLAPTLWLIYINDLVLDIPVTVNTSMYADDVALMSRGRSLGKCAEKLQPALNRVEEWCTKWKVTLSPGKCTYTIFSVDPAENCGKKRAQLRILGDDMPYEEHPTFLGLNFDGGLTFREQAKKIKKRMAERRHALAKLAGHSKGARAKTIKMAYLTTVRSQFDYGCGVWMPMCAPSVKDTLEAEQNACARLWTGCTRPTNTKTLQAVSGVPSLTHRAEERAGALMERILRLPEDTPARRTAVKNTKPRLKSRAAEAYRRKCNDARAAGEEPPEAENTDQLLTHRPCWRRTANRVTQEAGLETAVREATPLTCQTRPWRLAGRDRVTLAPTLGTLSRRTPDRTRTEEAMRELDRLTPTDWKVYTDGSAKEAIYNGGAGALIIAPDGTTTELKATAGRLCSSYRAELTALETALEYLNRTIEDPTTIRIHTDSKSAIQRLDAGPLEQKCQRAEKVWKLLTDLSDRAHIYIQWVPGHTGVPGNEEADRIAGEACDGDQTATPIDLDTATAAIKRRTRKKTRDRAHNNTHVAETKADRLSTQGCRTRWEEVVVNQLRANCSPLTREALFRVGSTKDPNCRDCGILEDVRHLLTSCGAWERPRAEIFGPSPTLEEALNDSGKVVKFLRRVGRVSPPVDS